MLLAQLEERLKLLVAERQRLLDDVNAFNGAIQEAHHWIQSLKADSKPKAVESDDGDVAAG